MAPGEKVSFIFDVATIRHLIPSYLSLSINRKVTPLEGRYMIDEMIHGWIAEVLFKTRAVYSQVGCTLHKQHQRTRIPPEVFSQMESYIFRCINLPSNVDTTNVTTELKHDVFVIHTVYLY